jgi:hypothetical protein
MPADFSASLRVLHARARRLLTATALAALGSIVVGCHSESTGPCTADKLAFTVQPTTTSAGTPFSVTVQAQDGSGNLRTCFTGTVSLSLQSGPAGATLSGTVSMSAVGGVAAFTGLSLSKSGAFSLRATSTSATTAGTSNSFSINPGPASVLAFTTQPVNAVAGATITVQVTARDQFGNTASGFNSAVQIALGANPGSGTLSGTMSVNAAAGVADFTTLTIDKVGNGYTLTATPGAGAPPAAATSNAFNITPGPTTKLAFTVQPSNASAGSPIAPSIQVSGQDAQGNLTPAFSGSVTIAIGTNPGAGALSGTTPRSATGGTATFTDLSINKPGTGYTLTATATGLTGATSATFNITVGPLAQLVFSTQPSNAAAGATIAPAVQVTGQDAGGNTVTSFAGNVTVAFGNNPGSGTLQGNLTRAAVAGVATFNDLSIDKTGTGYTLNATSGGVPQVSSATFNITAANAAKLAFTVQPVNTAAGSAITPAVQVTALDQFDNVAVGFASNVTVSIGTNANSGTLSGTLTNGAANGVVSFATLSIDSAGSGYTLKATAAGLTDATSSTFDIIPGAATRLRFAQPPSNATAGAAIAPAVTVQALDAKGNVATAFTGNVTVAIGTNPGGGTLSGTATAAAASGMATFATLSINKSGTGYTLTAASGSLTGATSAAFNIVAGAATQLAFTVQPANTAAGVAITPSVKVAAQDALGNTDLTYGANVTLAIGNNAGPGGILTGGGPLAAVNGVATFSASIDKVGLGYTLTAASGALTGATSAAFDIFANTATHLVFFTQPSNAVAGSAIAPAVVVHALDASDNVATGFSGAITLSITTATGDPAATLSGTTVQAASAGVATFSTLSIDKTADGYTLDAVAGGLTGATSTAFKITPGAATHLAFSVPPANTTAGVAISPAVQVQALDALNNVDTAYTANIVIGIGTNPGGGTLSGTASIAAVHGVSGFSNLSINKSGVGYTLHATSGTLTDATSGNFDISAAALAQLVFATQPANTGAGATITPAVVVQGQDAFGNKVTTFNGDVSLAIGTNPGTGTLSGTTLQTAASGDATFANLSIDKAGQGYTLIASATGASDGTSAAFNITPGTATMLVFTGQPAPSTTAGTVISSPITVAAQDAQGNTDPTFSGDVLIAIGTNGGTPTPGTLSGTTTITASAGVATFSNLSIDRSGTGYTLQATSGILNAATSNAFAITAGAATKLTYTVQPPASTTAGQSMTPAVQVSAQDALGNTDLTYTANVTVAITAGTGKTGAVLSGTKTIAANLGVASFAGLSIDSAGTAYTLTATSGALTQGVSSGFDIAAGTATQLLFSVQPTSAAAGATISPTVTVVAKDGIGNIDPSYTSTVTLTLPVNPGSATPNNASVAAVAGVATFSGLFLDKVGTGYKLQASDGGLTSPQSDPFNITPGAATQLAFIVQPSQVTVGANINPAVKVAAQDAFGNTVTTFSNNIAVSISTDPVGGTNLGGTTTKAAISGIATFSTLDLDQAGSGFALRAQATGLTDGFSSLFNVIPNTATQLFFNVQPPSNTTAGNVMATFSVEARDASGQPVPAYTGDVTIAITPNTGPPGANFAAGTTTRTASSGVATFDDIEIDIAASNYKLTATGTGGVTSTDSKFFAINPDVATSLVYAVQPSNATATATITPQIEVKAMDNFGNTATGFTDNVQMTISDANASGGTLSGTATKAAVAGIATFSDLSIDLAQTGHTLDATDIGGAGAGSVTSNSFDITVSTSNHLVFGTQPTAATAGVAITPFTVEARDASNSLLAGFNGNVTVSITSGTGTAGATLTGTKTVAASGGIATFSGLSIDKSGVNYQLSAVASGFAGTTSSTFTITSAAAAKVVFRQQPSSPTNAGVAISPAMTVELQDAFGNKVTGTAANVTLSISVNAGGGTLSGTTTQAINTGTAQATFPDISIDASGTGYRLQASSAGLSSDVSQAFTIAAGAADHLVFTVSPNSAVAGVAISPAVRVSALDALGNVANFNNDVTVSITPNTGTPGAVLSGTIPVTAASGVATFSDLSVNKAGTGYTLTATATGLTGTTSGTFDITPAAATALVFTVQPSNTAANASIAPPVVVTAVDQFGNTAVAFNGSITVAMGTNAGGAGSLLSGTKVKTATNGVVSFDDLSINNVGTGYTITAVETGGGGLPLIGSNAFNIF